jgi:hypothetical protein
MSTAVFIAVVAFFKITLEIAAVIQQRRAHDAAEARSTPIPVHAEGALPGEDLVDLPEQSAPASNADVSSATVVAVSSPHVAQPIVRSIDPKDLFNPAEFLVVARRRATPQRDLFDSTTVVSNEISYPSLPDDPREWAPSDEVADALSVEDEIYASSQDEEAFDLLHRQ